MAAVPVPSQGPHVGQMGPSTQLSWAVRSAEKYGVDNITPAIFGVHMGQNAYMTNVVFMFHNATTQSKGLHQQCRCVGAHVCKVAA